MQIRLTHTLALLGALSLTACSASTQEQDEDAGWCVDQEACEGEDDASAEDDAGADVEAGADASSDAEVPTDAGSDVDAGGERPLKIDPPTDLGQAHDLAVHRGTACALTDSRVWCWGDNTYGQAQPPEGDVWADRVVLTEKYGCVVGSSSGVVCWGDGAAEVAFGDGTRINGRFTMYGVSANSRVLCQSSDYVESTSVITCYDDDESWELDPVGAATVDVQYDEMYGGYPTVCYAFGGGGGYTYQCMHGEAVIEVTSTQGDWVGIRPTIRHDGNGQVSVLLADGDVAWFDLGLEARAEPGPRQATRLEVDWGTLLVGLGLSLADVQLVSPNCFFTDNYALLCRDRDTSALTLRARMSANLAAVHEQRDAVYYCFDSGYSDTSEGTTPHCMLSTF